MKKINYYIHPPIEKLSREKITLENLSEVRGTLVDVKEFDNELVFSISIYNKKIYDVHFGESDANHILERTDKFILSKRIGVIRIGYIVRVTQDFYNNKTIEAQ